MMKQLIFVFLCILGNLQADDVINNKLFPSDFLFGTATSAYQVEGAWNADGKGESNWDHLVHSSDSNVINGQTGDIACDSYHRYKQDIAILAELGVKHYRFSISWTRILPNGLLNEVNDAGVTYYKNLIGELKKSNITPFVTLFHFDTPQLLEDMGGWTSSSIINWFTDYATLCFELFGDDVKHWFTFNEPLAFCSFGYGVPVLAPRIKSPGLGEYLCIDNVVRAHAKTWQIYNKQFKSKQNGGVGIVINSGWFEPENNTNPVDIQASETKLQFTFGMYANPIIYGDYPKIVKDNIKRRSLVQGFKASRLPEFSDAEKVTMKGTFDFLGLNYYSSSVARPVAHPNPDDRGYAEDSEVETYEPDDWEKGGVAPWGLRKLLNWISKTYNNPIVYITENGMADPAKSTNDDVRISYIKRHLSNVRDAMDLDKINVKGYTYWSLMDNFEWTNGYTIKYGLYHVDFDSENRTRTPKGSVEFYKNVIKTRCLVDTCKE